MEILASSKCVNYNKLDVKPVYSTRFWMKDCELTTATVNQEGLESTCIASLSLRVTHAISMLEPLPEVLGNKGARSFILWGQGILSNYFQGTRELLIRLLGSKGH